MKNTLYIISIFILFSCKKNEQQDIIPYVPVNISINLSSPDFQPISVDGGFVYITGGYKGILIYRESSTTYRAFERACTYKPSNDCEKIAMDSSLLFMIDKCCESQFNLEGNVMSGLAPYALKQYSTTLNLNVLNIYN